MIPNGKNGSASEVACWGGRSRRFPFARGPFIGRKIEGYQTGCHRMKPGYGDAGDMNAIK